MAPGLWSLLMILLFSARKSNFILYLLCWKYAVLFGSYLRKEFVKAAWKPSLLSGLQDKPPLSLLLYDCINENRFMQTFGNLRDIGISTRAICPILHSLKMHGRWTLPCLDQVLIQIGKLPMISGTRINRWPENWLVQPAVVIGDVGVASRAVALIYNSVVPGYVAFQLSRRLIKSTHILFLLLIRRIILS